MNAGAVLVLKIRYLHWTRPPITGFFLNIFWGNWKVEIIIISHTHKVQAVGTEENSSEIKKSADI